MANNQWTIEIKVGAFIVAGLALLIVFIFVIGDISTAFQPGYQLRVIFPTANGITEGSPVQYAGVEVGKVQDVTIVQVPEKPAPQVELNIRLPSYVNVRADDYAAISTFGLLGEKYLALEPGAGAGDVIPPGGQLIGKPPVSTEAVIERSSEVLTMLKSTLEGINNVVGDPESRVYLKEAVQEARDATRQWRTLGERLNLAMMYVESGEGSLGKFIYRDDLYRQTSTFIEELRANPWKLLVRPRQQKPAPSPKP